MNSVQFKSEVRCNKEIHDRASEFDRVCNTPFLEGFSHEVNTMALLLGPRYNGIMFL